MAGELTGLVAGLILVLCYAGQELSRAGWRRTAAKFAGCKSYSIRHTLARELRKRRVPTEQISLFLGHLPSGVAATTSIYAPYDPGFLSDAMATIKDVMRELRGLLKRAHRYAVPEPGDPGFIDRAGPGGLGDAASGTRNGARSMSCCSRACRIARSSSGPRFRAARALCYGAP